MGRTLTIANMRPLILLAAVWCCSAQLVYHGYPWAPLATPLLAKPALAEGEDLKTVSIVSPFLRTGLHAGLHTGLYNGLHTGFHAGLYNGLHAGLPYSGLPLSYSVKHPESSLEATEFPYIYTEKEEESSRRKREASPFLSHYHSYHIPRSLLPYSGLPTYAGLHPLNTFGLGHLGPVITIDQEAEAETEAEEEEAPIPYSAYNALPVFSPISHGIYPHTGLLPYSGLHTYAGIHPLNLNTFGLGHQALGPVIKIDQEPEAEAEEEEAPSRRRRDVEEVEEVEVKLPYLHAVPTTKKVTVETKAYEGVDAATPADTKLIELTTKEHEVDVPAVKYVQPVLKYKPVTYTAHSVVPYAGLHAGIHTGFHTGLHTGLHAGLYNGLHAGLPYSGLPLSYSGLHPFGLTPYSPVLNIESSDE